MSRSFKKHPYVKDSSRGRRRSGRSMKDYANRKVRRNTEELPSKGSSYKKLFCSWDICDWSFCQTRDEAIAEYEKAQAEAAGGPRYEERSCYVFRNGEWEKRFYTVMVNRGSINIIKDYPTLKDWLYRWYKIYKMK